MFQPVNEVSFVPVWGKIIFSQASVILSTGGAWSGECRGLGGCLVWGGLLREGVTWWRLPPGTATAAGGTHPTGMHSCSFSVLFKIDFEKCLGKPKKI